MSRRMKDSGIEWIGEIPQNWEVLQHKRVMEKTKKICEKYQGEDILSLTTRGVIKRDLSNPKGKMPTTFDGYQIVEEGNLLLCLFDIDVTPRCVGLIKDNGLTSPSYTQFKMLNNNNSRYYDYLLRMIDNDKCFLHLSKNLRNSLIDSDFGMIKTIVPPISEQEKIANYLDEKISKINNLILKTNETIEEYKKYKQSLITEVVTCGLDKNTEMKDSNIKWIGKIPKHWNITKFKYVGKMISGYAFKSDDFTDKGVFVLKIGNIQPMEISLSEKAYIDTSFYEQLPTYRVLKNDLVFALTRPIISTGIKVAIYDRDEKALLNQRNAIFRPNSLLTTRWCYYIMLSAMFIQEFDTKIDKTGQQPNISHNDIQNISIPLPNRDEQEQITKFLDLECEKIDTLISKKEEVIIELENYKKSLIYECVTGKKEI